MEMIKVDGSMYEGGGQILRMSIALSAVLGKPVTVYNIRAKRSNPGLRRQHITAIESVKKLVNARTTGLSIGSMRVEFIPGEIRGRELRLDIGTAGSTMLVLQSLMPAAAFADGETKIWIRGGTDNPMAPPVDYIANILIPFLHKMGYETSLKLVKRGFYPAGGGIVEALLKPVKFLKPINSTEFGKIEKVTVFAYSCLLPRHIVERMCRTAYQMLREHGLENIEVRKEILYRASPKCSVSPGCGIMITVKTNKTILASNSLGARGKPAERVAEEAVKDILHEINMESGVDKHMADQLIVYMMLAKGESKIYTGSMTMHTYTCIKLAEMFVGEHIFSIDGEVNAPATITCRGIGLENKYLS